MKCPNTVFHANLDEGIETGVCHICGNKGGTIIRWKQDEEDHCYWYGYVGKVLLFHIMRLKGYWYTSLMGNEYEYTSLKSAKRGAERMLKRFLKDAGLFALPHLTRRMYV
mgnify:CR=1 FL=1